MLLLCGQGIVLFLSCTFFVQRYNFFCKYAIFFCIFAKKYDIWLYPQAFEHSVNTAFLLVKVGMDVEIEGCGDVGVTEEDADGFAVTAGFDTTRSKTMTQAVELYERDV